MSLDKRIEADIGGHHYVFSLLPATEALRILFKLVRLLGPGFANVLDVDLTKVMELDISKIKAGDIIRGIVEHLDEKEYEQIVNKLLSTVLRDGKPVQLAVDFGGNLSELFEVLGGALKANYGDFQKRLGVAGA